MPHPPPPVAASLARPARADPAVWFGADSYPAAALRRSAQGRAVARLAIGRVRRWLFGPAWRSADGWPDGDRRPARPRRRWLAGRWGRAVREAGPVALLAALMTWLDW